MDDGGLAHARAFVFSGIAQNMDFREMVTQKVLAVTGFMEFPDHYAYSAKDLQKIVETARQRGADVIVTTEKDFARLNFRWDFQMDLAVMGVRISWGQDEERFLSFIRKYIFSWLKAQELQQ